MSGKVVWSIDDIIVKQRFFQSEHAQVFWDHHVGDFLLWREALQWDEAQRSQELPQERRENSSESSFEYWGEFGFKF